MSRVAFRQCDVVRALRAINAVGNPAMSVEITPAGTIRILPFTTSAAPSAPTGDDLDAELEAWRAKHGDG